MKIHSLCLVKNEADIIEQTLRAAARWSDFIYVLDNGSTDGTWETVQGLSRELPAVVPYRQDDRPFVDSLRNDIFRHYARRAAPGDWWGILDADEFYLDDPRTFLAAVSPSDRAVWMQLYVYLFTDEDLARWRRQPELYGARAPIEARFRYYVVGEYSEPRFFRHSPRLVRLPDRDLRPIHPRRIRLKHFPYRSPEQIQRRLATRREPMLRGEFRHEKRTNWVRGGVVTPGPARPEDLPQSWEERVVSHAECHLDCRDGTYAEPPPWSPPASPSRPAGLAARGRALLRRMRRTAGRLLR